MTTVARDVGTVVIARVYHRDDGHASRWGTQNMSMRVGERNSVLIAIGGGFIAACAQHQDPVAFLSGIVLFGQ